MYEYLRPFCDTDRQRETLDALRDCPTKAAAARTLGIDSRNVYGQIKRLKKRAAKQGISPDHDMTRGVPDGYKVKGVSTYYNEDGTPQGQWVKSQIDPEQEQENQQEMLKAFTDKLPRERAVKASKAKHIDDLLNLYIITDYHLGMKCWWEETGDNWDTKLAEDMIVAWFQRAIKDAPAAQTAILGQLGDFLHWDGIEAVTPTAGNVLDVDTRFQKLIRVAIRVLRRVIRMLLKKHKYVHVVMAEGNHDIASSMWLREVFNVLYEEESRVTVDTSPDPYYVYEWGDTALAFHHGHKRKMAGLDHVLAAKFREVWGKTKYFYGHIGHLHQDKVLGTDLMRIEQHETLAAPDAYASRGGFLSGRSSKRITYHKEYGEVGRSTITPEML